MNGFNRLFAMNSLKLYYTYVFHGHHEANLHFINTNVERNLPGDHHLYLCVNHNDQPQHNAPQISHHGHAAHAANLNNSLLWAHLT